MILSKKRILALLLIFSFVFVVSLGNAFAAEIDVNLREDLDRAREGDMLEVLIRLDEEPTIYKSMNNKEAVNLMKNNASQSQKAFIEKLNDKSKKIKIKNSFWIVNIVSAEVEKGLVEEIAKMKEVRKLYSSFELKVPEPKSEPAANQSWEHVESTKAPLFWDEGYRGQGITVAVLDTGIDAEHPEFNNELSYWAEFDDAGNIISEDPDDAYDSDDHGSHTSGTVYARNIGQYNIGMAPEATMAHGLVLPAGGGSFEQVAAGMEWAADNGFDVVNMSLGAEGQHEIMAEASDNLLAADVLLLASIGNGGPGNTGAPGNTPSAVGVGAYGSNGDIAYFSGGGIVEYPGYDYDENSRIKPDISAPGQTIYSVQPGGGYQNMSGTSMSSPHLAGAAALIKSADPEMSAIELREILYNSVGEHDDLGWSNESEEKDTRFGWGRINVIKALEQLDFVEGPEATVEGVITSTDNKRVADVRLEFNGLVTKVVETNEEGEYEVSLPEGFYNIKVTRLGYEDIVEEDIEIVGTEDYTINYQLTPAPEGEISGTITDSTTGEVIVDASANIVAPIEEEVEVIDGEFSVSVMEEYYTLEFEREGYFNTSADNIRVAPGQTTTVDVEMVYGHENVTFTIVDSVTEMPIEEAEIYVEENEETYYTDEDGKVMLSLVEGNYNLEIDKTGYLVEEIELDVENGNIISDTIALEENAGTIEGNVTDVNGEPLVDAEITIADYNISDTTDEGGNYKLEGVEPGEQILMVSKDGYWEQQATVVVEHDETTNQDFELEPVESAIIFLEDFTEDNFNEKWDTVNFDSSGQPWHRTDRKSLFGDYSAWHGDPAEGEYPSNQTAELITSNYIELPEEGMLEFSTYFWPYIETTYDEFYIFIEYEDGSREIVFEYDGKDQTWLEIFGDISMLAGEKVKLGFGFDSDFMIEYEGTYIDGISITHIEERSYGSISGTVLDENQEPIKNANVTVIEYTEENKIKKTSQVVTGPNGKYDIDVPAGRWTVRASKAPDYFAKEKITNYIEPNGEVEQDFVLEENNPPAQVENLEVVAVGDGFVELNWDEVDEKDLDHYVVYRSINGEDFNKITTTEETKFTVEGLQNGYTYYFKVSAVDELGQESELSEAVEGNPVNETPIVSNFDISPKSVYRGAPVSIEAEIENPSDGMVDLALKAVVKEEKVREWTFEKIEEGTFSTSVYTEKENGEPLGATFHDFVLEATNEEGRTGLSETERILIMSPLPESLSFLVDNNPFDPTEESQRMDYTVPAKGDIEVAIYTIDNNLIKVIDEGEKEPGRHSTYWDGRNEKGEMVLNGAYIIKVKFTDNSGNTSVINKHSVVLK